jgi:hypothetical protein
MKKLILITIISLILFSCISVVEVKETKNKPSPPPHAPAHGVRAKYQYRYYPSLGIYYDINRGIYFYIEAGVWKSSQNPPINFKVGMQDFIVIDLDTDKPYKYYNQHKKQYPPQSNSQHNNPKKPKK